MVTNNVHIQSLSSQEYAVSGYRVHSHTFTRTTNMHKYKDTHPHAYIYTCKNRIDECQNLTVVFLHDYNVFFTWYMFEDKTKMKYSKLPIIRGIEWHGYRG